MAFRIAPQWWPLLGVASPVLAPILLVKNRRFRENRARADELNEQRINRAKPLDLPELDFVELTVLVEWEAEEGFLGDPAVSYLFRTDRGALLYDIGFGAEHPALVHNAAKLGIGLDRIDALVISHLHLDHMGGMKAMRSKRVKAPEELGEAGSKRCFLPDKADAEGFEAHLVDRPCALAAGIGSTGPLARSLFFFGLTEEQAIVARVKDKGLVVFTGCGHPTIETILKMVRRLSEEPLYAVGGGLHFPLTEGRGRHGGIQMQMMVGTGKPPWRRITEEDLDRTVAAINEAAPERVLLSAHDTCDYALKRFDEELTAETSVLKAGAVYRL